MSRKHCVLDLNFGDFEARVMVGYWFTPADPGVRYYPDGSGCPPTGPEIDVIEMDILTLTTCSGKILLGSWLKDRGWYKVALAAVWDRFDTIFEPEGSVWCDLLEDATNE